MFSNGSRVRADFHHLCNRIERRLYPETMQALGLYWLKTLWSRGYTRDEWNTLDRLLQEFTQHESRPECQQTVTDLRTWIEYARNQSNPAAEPEGHTEIEMPRRPLESSILVPYIVRLVNEWLPVEVARLLILDQDNGDAPENGIPAVATGRALERLLRRERLSKPTLEALLRPDLFSPLLMYPGDYEILRDVVVYLLGRTEAPAAPVLPARLLFIAPGAHLSSDYAREVERATLVAGPGGDELHVPIAPAQTMEALTGEQVRITSRIVTMDGRCWEAGRLTGGGGQNVIVYQTAGSLRIDYAGEHARIRIPWPEARYHWSGVAHFGPAIKMFGREWQMGKWEQDAEHTWVDLVFSRWLTHAEMGVEAVPRRAHPASVDLAWAALGGALSLAFQEKQPEALEKLRHEEMIPLARAIAALVDAVRDPHMRKKATIEARLRAIGFFAAAVRNVYGPVRWRILPEPVRRILLSPPLYPALSDCLHEIFDELPEIQPPRLERPVQWLNRLRRAAPVS